MCFLCAYICYIWDECLDVIYSNFRFGSSRYYTNMLLCAKFYANRGSHLPIYVCSPRDRTTPAVHAMSQSLNPKGPVQRMMREKRWAGSKERPALGRLASESSLLTVPTELVFLK